ncbi:VapE domain-containing protein [Asinibacterium sp. OR53]|uniref:VapE domain-containing protein n=1 Tax=Asinibacterium sp. OR53 TaxID=925409 RepID=UPI000A03DF2F|nr:VapE domain-containing protein [Asinibacterium sp. OR53]
MTDKKRFKIQFKKYLVRCVACALEPTVFNKQVFVLVGEGQNTGKSTFCRWLCPTELNDYFTEYVSQDKDGLIALSSNFLINLDELATLSKVEINALKSFISKDKISVRLPYAKRSTTQPRRANFIGSTNNDEFLVDETGNVRWQCFEVAGIINFAYMKDININDIWRQAYTLYKSGFQYQLTAEELKENEKANSKHLISSSEIELIDKYFQSASRNEGEFKTATDILDFLALRHPAIKLNDRKIGKAMKILGFEKISNYTAEKKHSVKGYFVIAKT